MMLKKLRISQQVESRVSEIINKHHKASSIYKEDFEEYNSKLQKDRNYYSNR